MATIELAKNYTPAKMTWPAIFQQKLDGVPVLFTRTEQGMTARTRQDEEVYSCEHIKEVLVHVMQPGHSVVAEMYNPRMPFKDISGLVRRKDQQAVSLSAYVFDSTAPCDVTGKIGYGHRLGAFWRKVKSVYEVQKFVFPMPRQCIVWNDDEVQQMLKTLPQGAEGACIHTVSTIWEPGKRKWQFQKIKPNPTIDLRVVGFSEAIDKYGEPKGMVGRVVVSYKGKHVGVGPGALTHKERTDLWERWSLGPAAMNVPNIAEIKYMPDDTYDALRQATFVRWRPDKENPDA